jgi:hypothetical protein
VNVKEVKVCPSLTSKASSRSGAFWLASFLTLPRSVALWKGIGCSIALYLRTAQDTWKTNTEREPYFRVNADFVALLTFLFTISS